MGFLKDLRHLSALGKEASKDYDPAAQLRVATAQMNQMAAQSRLAQAGSDASAIVVALHDTRTQINLQPVMEVELTVMAPGRVPFAATATMIGHAQLGLLVPGAQVAVRYDDADPSTVVIV